MAAASQPRGQVPANFGPNKRKEKGGKERKGTGKKRKGRGKERKGKKRKRKGMTAQNLPGAGKIWDEQKERKGRGKERKATTARAKGKKGRGQTREESNGFGGPKFAGCRQNLGRTKGKKRKRKGMTAQNLPGAGKIWDEQKERKGRGKERKGMTAQNLPGAGKIWDEQKERKGRGKE